MINQFWLVVCGCLFFLGLALADDDYSLLMDCNEMEKEQ